MSERLRFVATSDDVGHRIDVTIALHTDRSRTASADLIRKGHVRVNGATVKPAYDVVQGDRIDIDLPEPLKPAATPEKIPIHFVYEDADLCVVDKPAGMATHPAPGSLSGTLVNALLAALGPLPAINGVLRAGIVHRLDKGTSGLLVVAKSDRAMRGLSAAIAARQVYREYDAVVWGLPPHSHGLIDAPLGRDPVLRKKFAVREDGRAALTRYRMIEPYKISAAGANRRPRRKGEELKLALLSLTLETGRTHQIRVHCAAIGNPIVGDTLYGLGKPRLGMMRQALHAARLRFSHPVSAKPMAFSSAWPQDFAALVNGLRLAGSP